MTARLMILLASVLFSPVAMAQMAPAPSEPCAPLTPELAGWTTPAPVIAATAPAGVAKAALIPGKAAKAHLTRTASVTYVVRPEKPGGSVSYGGLFVLTIAQAGTYRIGLGSGAWIDVLKGKTSVISSAHGHGPACTGVMKMVDFPLAAGRYVVQIAANGTDELPLMVARLP